MDLNIPRPEPIRGGDYRTFVTMGYGSPYAVIHLAEGSALDLDNLTAGDCDRLIRAAAKVKGQILGIQARAAAPHGRASLYQGTCQLCGKPEDDELHAEPPRCPAHREMPGAGDAGCAREDGHPGQHAAGALTWTGGTSVSTEDDEPAPEPGPYDKAIQQAEFFAQPGNTIDDALAEQRTAS